MAIAMVGCEYDDSELTNRVNNLEDRVVTLEQLCSQMNTNITAMQAIVNALQTQDAITAVTPITEGGKTIGYTITFAKGDPITIYHGQNGKDGADGEDGEDGYTPVIGVDQDEDGVYYWTLDGEWLTDADGNKIATSGKDGEDGADGEGGKSGMPELKIQGGYWYVSYDGGENWERLGRATGYDGSDGKDGANGDAFFEKVVVNEQKGFVTFYFTDDTKPIEIPLYKLLTVTLTPTQNYIEVNGEDLTINYDVNCDNPTVVVISDLDAKASNGVITVKAPADNKGLDDVEAVTLMVSNGSTTVMASVDITVADAVISGGANAQSDFANALSEGKTSIVLSEGEYTIPAAGNGKTLTISGSTDDASKVVIKVVPQGGPSGEANGQLDYSLDGSTVTFNNLTIKTNNQTYAGYARSNATFNNCIMDQCFCLNGKSEFTDCVLNVSGDQYNIWTWGAPEATFTGCTFNCDGKAVLVYNSPTTVTFNHCIFNDNGTISGKSAIETGADYGPKKYDIFINDITIKGFDVNSANEGYKNIVGNKNSLTQEYLNIVIDGVDVY